MKKSVIASGVLLLSLSACVAAGPYEPYPGYSYNGAAYDYYPYTYYYGDYGAYPSHRDYHRHYNWGYWNGNGGHWNGHWPNEERAEGANAERVSGGGHEGGGRH